MPSDWLVDGSAKARLTVVLAHGAGAPMDSPFMDYFAHGLARAGHRVVRFEFPYMRRRRTEGKKPGPDRPPVLVQTWKDVVAALDVPPASVVVGGKSMGGRIASLCAEEMGVAGLLCLGYPFHPTGKPDRLRVEHFADLQVPTLICQGARDTMGSRESTASVALPVNASMLWLEDGDHSFKPRKSSGLTEEGNLAAALAGATDFLDRL